MSGIRNLAGIFMAGLFVMALLAACQVPDRDGRAAGVPEAGSALTTTPLTTSLPGPSPIPSASTALVLPPTASAAEIRTADSQGYESPTITTTPSPTPDPTPSPVRANLRTTVPISPATVSPALVVAPTAEVPLTPAVESIPRSVGSDSTVDELIAATRSDEWKVRWDAVNELGARKELAGKPALVDRALFDDNPHPRWRSLWALSTIDRTGQAAIGDFVSALDNNDPTVVHNAAVALAFFGRPEALPQLLLDLKEPDDYRRWEAVFSLKEVGDIDAAEELRGMLDPQQEPKPDVRAQAALTLGSIGGPGFVDDLTRTLQEDPASKVRIRAALALSQIGDRSAIHGLETAATTETEESVLRFINDAIKSLQAK